MISRADERDGGFNCPFCGASVVGTICQCGVEFKEESVLQAQQRRSKPEKTNQWKCPRCGELNIKGASNCKHCSVGFRYEPETPKIDYRAIQIQDLAGKVSDLEVNITALDDAQKPQQKAEQRELKCPSCGEPIKTYGASNCKHCSVGFRWVEPQTPKKDPWQAEYEQEKARAQGLTEQVSALEGKVKQYEAQQAAGPKLKKVRAAVETKTSVPAAGAPAQKPTEAFALLGMRKVHGSEFITTKRPGSDAPFEYRLGGPRGDRVILPDGSWPSTGTNYATLVELYNKAKTQKPQGEAALPTYVMIEERELETIINKQGAVESKLKEKTSAHSTLQAKYDKLEKEVKAFGSGFVNKFYRTLARYPWILPASMIAAGFASYLIYGTTALLRETAIQSPAHLAQSAPTLETITETITNTDVITIKPVQTQFWYARWRGEESMVLWYYDGKNKESVSSIVFRLSDLLQDKFNEIVTLIKDELYPGAYGGSGDKITITEKCRVYNGEDWGCYDGLDLKKGWTSE